MGCTLAYDLAAMGRSVVVVDRSTTCSGSSGVNAGGVRHQFTSETNIRMAARSIDRIASFEETHGVEVAFRQVGYLFLVSRSGTEPVFRSAIEVQRSCGVQSEWLSPREIEALVPMVSTGDLIGGAFCSSDGYLDPHSLVTGFASAARGLGADFRQNCAVMRFDIVSNRIVSMRTSTGDMISSDVVVNAAGAWAVDVARLAGVELDITPWHSQIFLIDGIKVPQALPMTIDFDNGKMYFHREGEGLLAGNDDGWQRDTSWPIAFDDSRAPTIIERLVRRCPVLEDARVKTGWAGLLEITPDENPIVGWTGLDNLYTTAGFSGHGFSIAPGLSPEAARDLCGQPPSLPLDDYRPGRFESSRALTEKLSLR
jgi:sarcosine oxidase subunit beta